MLKRIMAVVMLLVCVALPSLASSARSDDMTRINASARVFREIMTMPDKGIPQELIESAKCIAVIPGEKQAAFIVGGQYGKGLATCRTPHGWSAPVFLVLGGGSVGFQIGGSSTDIVMVFTNDNGLQHLLSDKFKVGADATAAAGPVGRHVAAGTDIKLNSEILTYSRSQGAFAGVSLNGAEVQSDQSGDRAMYGSKADRKQILDGATPVPKAALPLLEEIAQYARERATTRAAQAKSH